MLDGARALALPTRFGQSITVKEGRGSEITWESVGPDNVVWFKNKFSLFDFSPINQEQEARSQFITDLLKGACRLNSEFLSAWKGLKVTSTLEFSPDWGLGSSSSLIYCVAQWAEVNPFYLHFDVSNGSGYDIACAGTDNPITYVFANDEISYGESSFAPSFRDSLYFIYLGNKASSHLAVKDYSNLNFDRKDFVSKLGELTEKIENCKSLKRFEDLIVEHEKTVSHVIGKPMIKEDRFPDYWGAVKSLGAWGGDFALATSAQTLDKTRQYFADRGCDVVLAYKEMIK